MLCLAIYASHALVGFMLPDVGTTAIGITLLVRVLYHSYQRPVGALSVCLKGLFFRFWFQRTGRLFPLVFALIAIDLIVFL